MLRIFIIISFKFQYANTLSKGCSCEILVDKDVFKFQYDNTLSFTIRIYFFTTLSFKFQYDNTLRKNNSINYILKLFHLNSNMIIL